MDGVLLPILIVIAVIVIAIAILYNSLVRKRNNVQAAWANIDVQLQRRFDLIPNLVETVKGYAAHEQETFLKVTELRNSYLASNSPKEIGEIDTKMNAVVKHLFAVAEAYPDLKASQNFLMLQESLAGTENRIAYSRNNYNQTVMSYNTGIQTFPAALLASPLGFQAKEFFKIGDEGARDAVKVDLG
jgi:LemA protein